MTQPKKRKGRALLIASVGVAVTTFGCKEAHVGNLRPIEVYLPDGGPAPVVVVDAGSQTGGPVIDASAVAAPVDAAVSPIGTATAPPTLTPHVGNLRPFEMRKPTKK